MTMIQAFNDYCKKEGIRANGQYALEDVMPHFEAGYKALLAELSKQEPLTESYVQTVPDKCDRIVWRNQYIHLPIANTAEIEQRVAEACVKMLKSKHSHECSAAAHHAGSWQPAYEYHMTRQAAISECVEVVENGKWREFL